MHNWGDGWPFFEHVENAASEIGQFCRKWGRISVTSTKEKYGCCRVYCSFGHLSLHQMIYPGYTYNRFPQWLWNLDWAMFHKILNIKPINTLFFKYQVWIYNLAYKKAVKKYPHIREEILVDADFLDLLPWAKDVQDRNWVTVTSSTKE